MSAYRETQRDPFTGMTPAEERDANAGPRNAGGRPRSSGAGKYRRLSCPELCDAGTIVYCSTAQIDRGRPRCACGAELVLTRPADRIAVEPLEFQRETEARAMRAARDAGANHRTAEDKARVAWNDELRAAGLGSMVVAKIAAGRGGDKRCDYPGANCRRFTSGRYCPEHEAMAAAGAELTPARRSL